jgi:hypothetical protein
VHAANAFVVRWAMCIHVAVRQQVGLERLVKLEIMRGCVCDGAVIEGRRAVSAHMLGIGPGTRCAAQFVGVVAWNWSADRLGT